MLIFIFYLLDHRFSRRLLWLRVADTNNNPRVVASYFIDYVTGIKGTILILSNPLHVCTPDLSKLMQKLQ